jgi:hypothetical protein
VCPAVRLAGGLGRKLRKMRATAGGLLGCVGRGLDAGYVSSASSDQALNCARSVVSLDTGKKELSAGTVQSVQVTQRRCCSRLPCRRQRAGCEEGPCVRAPRCSADARPAPFLDSGGAQHTNSNLFIAASRGFVCRIPRNQLRKRILEASVGSRPRPERTLRIIRIHRAMRKGCTALRLLLPLARAVREEADCAPLCRPATAWGNCGPNWSLSDG